MAEKSEEKLQYSQQPEESTSACMSQIPSNIHTACVTSSSSFESSTSDREQMSTSSAQNCYEPMTSSHRSSARMKNFAFGGSRHWKSSDEDDDIEKRHRRKHSLKPAITSNRRCTSHSSTYPSSCTTYSFPRSSDSELSAIAVGLSDERAENSNNKKSFVSPSNIALYRLKYAQLMSDDVIGSVAPVIPQRHLLVVNVSGRRFHLDIRHLNQHPHTLLGDIRSRNKFYDVTNKELFFDRHQKSFEAIHDFYMKGGSLSRPYDVPLDIFLNEVRFYRFGKSEICEFLSNEGILLDKKVKVMPDTELKRIIWRIFEDHDSSWEARVITLLSAAIITLSVIVFCLETLPDFEAVGERFKEHLYPALNKCVAHSNGSDAIMRDVTFLNDVITRLTICEIDEDFEAKKRYLVARCLIHLKDKEFEDLIVMLHRQCNETRVTHDVNHRLRHKSEWNGSNVMRFGYENDLMKINDLCMNLDNMTSRSPYFWYMLESHMKLPAGIIFIIETSCIVWFVFEILLRFYCSPTRRSFFMNFLNIIDVLAILPYFITLLITTIAVESSLRPQTATILRTIRLVRMLRILKLSRYSRGFRILGLTLVRSTRVLFLLVCFQVVLAVFFSSIGYFVENETKGTQFTSIPESFWWALITMTTVGYGDICPTTLWGKVTGACCAIMGILSISFPVPVIVSNFNYLYNQDKDDCKLAPEDLMQDDQMNEDQTEEQINSSFSRFERFSNLKSRRETVKSHDEKIEKTPVLLWNLVKEHYTKRANSLHHRKRSFSAVTSQVVASNRNDSFIEERNHATVTSSVL